MRPKKSLGQNFLTSKKIVDDIVAAADLKPDDVVLEVGPGKGILTEALLKAVPQAAKGESRQGRGKVIAVEKDKRLVEFLKEKFHGTLLSDSKKVFHRGYGNLEIINDDILKFDFTRYASQVPYYKIVANIPYYITSHFLRKFLESDFQPSKMVLMVQKEVAERILARDKKESILSISIKAYGQPKIIKKVPARYFSPKPKVDSAILLIDNISKDFFKNWSTLNVDQSEKRFFEIVKQGFSSKRKMLKNNLKLLDTECSVKCKISETARAEELSLENWQCLAKNCNL